MTRTLLLMFLAAGWIASGVSAQLPDSSELKSTDIDAPISTVTVYQGRAAVTRRATLTLQAGLHELRFLRLPESIQPETIQTRITGDARVLDVVFDQQPAAEFSTPETEALDRRITTLNEQLQGLARQGKLAQSQEAFLHQVGVRAASEATDAGGTNRLDLDAIRTQMQFLEEELAKILDRHAEIESEQHTLETELAATESRRRAIGGPSNVMRLAALTLAVREAGELTVELSYLVSNASWQPSYNIRAASDGSGVEIEYDAMLTQQTGEDWNEVAMTLSTAQPMLAANPPTLTPWVVDILDANGLAEAIQLSDPSVASGAPELSGFSSVDWAGMQLGDPLIFNALFSGEGSAASYRLTRPVTVQTNLSKQQRSRITTIATTADFVHVAIPLLTEAVYIRGELTNASEFLLLPGPVSIYVGQDYIGPTRLEGVAAGGTFDMYFGIDPEVHATRMLVDDKTTKTGLFGGGLKTSYDYRLEIDNGAGKDLLVEVWDRQPTSLNDQIKIDLVNLNRPLATDPDYLTQFKPRGLLKWRLGVPATAHDRAAYVIEFGVRINRARTVDMTGLPR